MNYRLQIEPSAQKAINKLPARAAFRIDKAIRLLRENPRRAQCKKLKGSVYWRMRVGDYRIVYDIQDGQLLILVVQVVLRRDAYKDR